MPKHNKHDDQPFSDEDLAQMTAEQKLSRIKDLESEMQQLRARLKDARASTNDYIKEMRAKVLCLLRSVEPRAND